MLLTRLHATGLAVPVALEDLDRTTPLPRAPSARAAADALSLWKAALVGPDASLALTELGWTVVVADIDLEDEPQPPTWDVWEVDDADVDSVLAIGADEVHVDVSIAPDPPLYGRLREQAVRDPRLVTALGQQAELHVKVGVRRLRATGAISLDLLGARVGDVAFPIAGKERPAWLAPFLAEVARRIHRVHLQRPAPVETLHRAGLARDPTRRAAYQRALAALGEAPFGLPAPHLVRDHARSTLAFGPEAWPDRLLDRDGSDALHLVAACFLDAPDVLVVPTTLSVPVRAWLDARTEGDDAVLEQVLAP
jgi:hypothetical protein